MQDKLGHRRHGRCSAATSGGGTAACIAGGTALLAYDDAVDCAGGSGGACGRAAVTVGFGALGAAGALGGARAAAPRIGLQKALQGATARFAERGFTPAQSARLSINPKLYPLFRGERIDAFMRQIVREDSKLSRMVNVTPRGIHGPDFVDTRIAGWYDVTTAGQWLRHIKSYGEGGFPLFYGP